MERFRTLWNPATAVTLIGLLVGLALTTGCESGTEEPAAPAAPATSTGDAPDAMAGTEGGEAASDAPARAEVDSSRFPTDLPEGVEAAIPYNFPTDLPIYPGSQPAQGRGAELDGVEMSAVQLVTGDSPQQAYDFYKSKLESDGWTIENSRDVGKNAAISAAKGDRKISLLIAPALGRRRRHLLHHTGLSASEASESSGSGEHRVDPRAGSRIVGTGWWFRPGPGSRSLRSPRTGPDSRRDRAHHPPL